MMEKFVKANRKKVIKKETNLFIWGFNLFVWFFLGCEPLEVAIDNSLSV